MFDYSVKAVVGNKRAVHSQLIHLQGQDFFKIYLESWSCTVRFLDDGGTPRYAGTVIDGHLYIDLHNHNNSLGESIFTPFVIAKTTDGDIYMTYSTQLIDAAVKVRRLEFVLWMDEQ